MASIGLMSIPSLLQQALSASPVADPTKYVMDGSPELKHEDFISTLISAHLCNSGVNSKRKQAVAGRSIDIVINGCAVESKYHFEGDLLGIQQVPLSTPTSSRGGWATACDDLARELSRIDDSYFLWQVCVRDNSQLRKYKYSKLITNFYNNRNVSTLRGAVTSAEDLIDGFIWEMFQQLRPGLIYYRLPLIHAKESTLISRLYCLTIDSSICERSAISAADSTCESAA